jgi:hypothetical protein
MPITFHFRPEAELVICVHSGKVPDHEFLTSYKALYENDLFNTSMNLLVDLRQVDSSPRSRDVLYQFANFMQGRYADTGAHPKVAVVAPEDLSFGLARMYEVFADGVPWDFVVFRVADAALAWLGVPEDFMDDLNKDAQQ